MNAKIVLLLLLGIPIGLTAQNKNKNKNKLSFHGQLSVFGSYAPNNDLELGIGGRYLPELRYSLALDTTTKFDALLSGNLSGNVFLHPFDSTNLTGGIYPYRAWARLTGKQFEVRLGLQKIDFGSAMVLRPLQWFNQVNPRDPLGITNGVYGLLGRYYFLNNANIWLWALYGNEDLKGFDVLATQNNTIEIGGRVQYPIPRGEVGLSYHYRMANAYPIMPVTEYENIPESRYGLDLKWNLTIGLWLEASHVQLSKNIGILTTSTLINMGMDYTFDVGNGITTSAEHLLITSDSKAFQFQNNRNITALTITYPLGFFDKLLAIATYNWDDELGSFFLDYEHLFKHIAAHIMVFYTPNTPSGLIRNEMEYAVTGPGIRIMAVYHH